MNRLLLSFSLPSWSSASVIWLLGAHNNWNFLDVWYSGLHFSRELFSRCGEEGADATGMTANSNQRPKTTEFQKQPKLLTTHRVIDSTQSFGENPARGCPGSAHRAIIEENGCPLNLLHEVLVAVFVICNWFKSSAVFESLEASSFFSMITCCLPDYYMRHNTPEYTNLVETNVPDCPKIAQKALARRGTAESPVGGGPQIIANGFRLFPKSQEVKRKGSRAKICPKARQGTEGRENERCDTMGGVTIQNAPDLRNGSRIAASVLKRVGMRRAEFGGGYLVHEYGPLVVFGSSYVMYCLFHRFPGTPRKNPGGKCGMDSSHDIQNVGSFVDVQQVPLELEVELNHYSRKK
ncbi:hypothetical protein B0H17DRAFT_1127037 [Mycena rosella]|uniref:Uncharacterized protein n=1 Tax=Mycena rosella TaxID=1033263 RepID=A0AAD7GS09_MYCRO|nr:hypothetical protein B0H17DRAFT_1127037 [Mycena rosella]